MRLTLLIAATLPIGLTAALAEAKVIYVNNRTGEDTNDGVVAERAGLRSGPVRSLRRAGLLVGPGDVIEIANTGSPYYGSLRLVGGNACGVPSQPVTVAGNGAVFDGSVEVAENGWEALGNNLWRLEPAKKGWFQLVRGETPVPEMSVTDDSRQPVPPPGQWATWRGAIYYRAEPDEIPANEPYRLALHETGVFLYGVRHVVVRDLTLRHFRLDGVNAHDLVTDVTLQNLTCESNGRSGIFVGGSSKLILEGGAARNNRDAAVLLREKGKIDIRDADLDTEPVVAE